MTGLMHGRTARFRTARSLMLLVAAGLMLIGCGVSGKPSSAAQSTTTATTPTSDTTSTTPSTDSTVPETTDTTTPDAGGGDTTIPTEPPSSDTTIPDTTIPDSGNPFSGGDIKRTLIRIYKQSGFTDKEANCVADLIVKQSNGGTFDPSKLDVTKLSAAARRCFGADGVPGGSD